MGGVVGVVNDVVTVVVTSAVAFAENVVAAGAAILNDFLNVLAGPAAKDKIIEEFSTQNAYLYNDDEYINNLYNIDRIAINSLIKGTPIIDEILNFYKKAKDSSDFINSMEVQDAWILSGSGTHQENNYYSVWDPDIRSNFNIGLVGYTMLDSIVPSVTLRVNNLNLFEGDAPAAQYAGNNNNYSNFTWHTVLEDDNGMQGAEGYYRYAPTLTSTTFPEVQQNTKNYLKVLGMPDPENLLDDLPYTTSTGAPGGATYSDVIDSVFLNFRVKWVSGNTVSNKYLWILAEHLYEIEDMPDTLEYDSINDEITMFHYDVNGDGHNYSMGCSHVTTATGNNVRTSSNPYEYNNDLKSNDGYYYYDANKTLPEGDSWAETTAQVQTYLNSNVGTSEVKANWLEIRKNDVTVTIGGVDSIFPDEIYLPGSGITLTMFSHTMPAVPGHYVWTATGCPGPNATNLIHYSCTVGGVVPSHLISGNPSGWFSYVAAVPAYDVWKDAADQVLRVGNLYIKKSSTEITFATIPSATYSESSITLGKSNATGVTYYTVYNVTAIERITDYNNDNNDTKFRYISHKLDASNNCVSAPIVWGILEGYSGGRPYFDPFEQHQLILASANMSMHLAYYERIEKTWEQKLRAATLEVIRIGAIVYTVVSLGTASSLAVLAETAITAYATSLAVNAIIENIIVPVIISNFGEDEALILLAVAAVAIAVYSSKSGTAGLNQFSNQAALFTTSVDIMNQMYTLAVVQPGIIEMQKEQDEWTATDNELTEKEEAFQENYEAVFGTEDSPSYLVNLQIRAALNPMPASAYFGYHDGMLERQFDCFDYEKYNELNVS